MRVLNKWLETVKDIHPRPSCSRDDVVGLEYMQEAKLGSAEQRQQTAISSRRGPGINDVHVHGIPNS